MKRITILLLIGFFTMYSSRSSDTKTGRYYDTYVQIFNRIDSLLQNDNGRFWDYPLYGPIMFVNPDTRAFIANQNDISKSFLKVDDLYTGTLPPETIIANTALDWGGKKWAMVLLPLPSEYHAQNNLIIHELFHRIQSDIGFDGLVEHTNEHLDAYKGRLLLRLELQALYTALQSSEEEKINTHICNALWFRRYRQDSPKIMRGENASELNEGLAEYTGLMLSERNDEEIKNHLKNAIKVFYKKKTFVRSFAYQTIPVYGYLLAQNNSQWHKEITKNTNLSSYIEKAFSLDHTKKLSMESIISQNDYGFEKIKLEEEKREKENIKKIEAYKKLFLEKPTLKLYFQNMNISFNPNNLIPLENIGTIYPTLKITDNWGILEVNKEALVSADWTHVVLTEPIEINGKTIKGEGWLLNLKDAWKITKEESIYKLKME